MINVDFVNRITVMADHCMIKFKR